MGDYEMIKEIITPGLVVIFPAGMTDLDKTPYLIFGENTGENVYLTVNILPYIFEYEGIYDLRRLKEQLRSKTMIPAEPRELDNLKSIVQRTDAWTRIVRKFMNENHIKDLYSDREGIESLLR